MWSRPSNSTGSSTGSSTSGALLDDECAAWAVPEASVHPRAHVTRRPWRVVRWIFSASASAQSDATQVPGVYFYCSSIYVKP